MRLKSLQLFGQHMVRNSSEKALKRSKPLFTVCQNENDSYGPLPCKKGNRRCR